MKAEKIICFLTVFVLCLTSVLFPSVNAANALEFSENDFMEILSEAEVVMNFYLRPVFMGESREYRLSSAVAGEFNYLAPVEIDGTTYFRLIGGLSKPEAYKKFLGQYFSSSLTENLNGRTILDYDADRVYWTPSAFPEVNSAKVSAEYKITEFTGEKVVCHAVFSADWLENKPTEEFDYIYEKQNGRWLFTTFMTKEDFCAKLIAAEENDDSSDTQGTPDNKTQQSGLFISGGALVLSILAAALAKKDKKTLRAFSLLLVLCISAVSFAACSGSTGDPAVDGSERSSGPAASDPVSTDWPAASVPVSTDVPAASVPVSTDVPAASVPVSTDVPAAHVTDHPGGDTVSLEDWEYNVVESGTNGRKHVILTKYTGSSANVVIPEAVGEVPVSEISANAFSDNENARNIISMSVPAPITLRSTVFEPLTKLESLTVAKLNSFSELCRICFGDANDGRIRTLTVFEQNEIPAACFKNAKGLVKVTYTQPLESIGDDAFNGCAGLTECAANTVKVGANAFAGCVKLTAAPLASAEVIRANAFSGCTALSEVTFSRFLHEIRSNAFDGCSGLKKIVCEAAKLIIPDESGIGRLPALEEISFANDVKEVPAYMFCGAGIEGSLAVKGSGLKTLGKGAFSANNGMRSITLPERLEAIGNDAFSYCIGLESISIPSTLRSVGSSAFQYCCSLSELTFPESAVDFGESAFAFCDHLTSVSLSANVTTIPARMFYGCASLKEFSHPCKSVGSKAFWFCTSLESVDLAGADYDADVFNYCFVLFPDTFFRIPV